MTLFLLFFRLFNVLMFFLFFFHSLIFNLSLSLVVLMDHFDSHLYQLSHSLYTHTHTPFKCYQAMKNKTEKSPRMSDLQVSSSEIIINNQKWVTSRCFARPGQSWWSQREMSLRPPTSVWSSHFQRLDHTLTYCTLAMSHKLWLNCVFPWVSFVH